MMCGPDMSSKRKKPPIRLESGGVFETLSGAGSSIFWEGTDQTTRIQTREFIQILAQAHVSAFRVGIVLDEFFIIEAG